MLLRMFRLARLARTVRLLAQFKVLWMLVRGLFASAGTMVYVTLLASLVVYVFGVLSLEVITKPQFALTEEERAGAFALTEKERQEYIVYDEIARASEFTTSNFVTANVLLLIVRFCTLVLQVL